MMVYGRIASVSCASQPSVTGGIKKSLLALPASTIRNTEGRRGRGMDFFQFNADSLSLYGKEAKQ